MSKDNLRLALIGTGNISRHHVWSMADLKKRGLAGFTVTSVCDVNEELAEARAQEIEAQLGTRPAIYTDYRQLLARAEVDVADLCLPHGLHHVVATDCMQAGVHVLCEKPLGVTIRACRKMAEMADKTGCVLSTAVPSRRLLSQRAVRWLFNEAKLIGEPLAFFHQHAGPLWPLPTTENEPRRLWRKDRLMSGGMHVIDSGFHYCDTMRYLLGDVEKVYAELRELAFGSPRKVDQAPEDAVFATLTFKNGVVGTWCFGLILPGEVTANIIFYCSQGSLRDLTDHRWRVFHLFRGNARRGLAPSARLTKADGSELSLQEVEAMYLATLSQEQKEYCFPRGVADGFSYQIWEFLETVRRNRPRVEVDGWEGMRSLAICEAIYESALTGQVVQVDDVLDGRQRAYQAAIDAHWGL